MLYFFSFCCLIGKQTKEELLFALHLLIHSLKKYVKEFQFIIYTNFDLKINDSNIIIRKYYTHSNNIDLAKKNKQSEWANKWKNLSMNKIFIYHDLFLEFKKDFIWIDLDTYIFHDLSFMNQYDNYFIQQGGNYDYMEPISSEFQIKWPLSIQGNFFKLNITLFNNLIKLLHSLNNQNINLYYDSQSLFTYYFYKVLNNKLVENNIYISGNTIQKNILNSVSIWCPETKQSFATKEGLNNLYIENNNLKSKYHPNKEIQIVSFTFHSLIKIKNEKKFKDLFIENISVQKFYIHKNRFRKNNLYLRCLQDTYLIKQLNHDQSSQNKIQLKKGELLSCKEIIEVSPIYYKIILK